MVKSLMSKSLLTMILCATAAMPVETAARGHQEHHRGAVQYSVVNLGALGGTMGYANVLNQEGWTAGEATLMGDKVNHAFLWRGGRMKDLGTLGGPNSFAIGLNDLGVAVGVSDTTTPDPLGEDFCTFGTHLICSGVVWHDGRTMVLPTLGGNNANPEAVNDRGQVTGYTETAKHDSTCRAPQVLQIVAAIWDLKTERVLQLPTLPGDRAGYTQGMNQRGHVAGFTGDCVNALPLTSHAVIWRDGKATKLGSLGGKMDNGATDINNRDQVVGVSDLSGDMTAHAFLWQKGVMTDLGTLPGDSLSFAKGINDAGQVVGSSCDVSGNCSAFLWQDGLMMDLNALIPPHSPLHLLQANDINSHGDISGYAYDQRNGATPAFVAVPDNSAPARVVGNPSRRFMLPDRVREQLRRHEVFARFRLGL
jgi:probable HAF family extracellular repeat protein